MFHLLISPGNRLHPPKGQNHGVDEIKCGDTYLRPLFIHGAGTVALLTKLGLWITELKNVARPAWQPPRMYLYKPSAPYQPY